MKNGKMALVNPPHFLKVHLMELELLSRKAPSRGLEHKFYRIDWMIIITGLRISSGSPKNCFSYPYESIASGKGKAGCEHISLHGQAVIRRGGGERGYTMPGKLTHHCLT